MQTNKLFIYLEKILAILFYVKFILVHDMQQHFLSYFTPISVKTHQETIDLADILEQTKFYVSLTNIPSSFPQS